ncbi:MAG: hypothetical protein FWE67_14260, partial [Planctomycetaceae bacterium]|nr:hypothetical protein [Planctomycetaceae bacterium]
RFCDLHGVENKSIAGSISKNNKKKTRQQLEKVSEGYDLRFLLGIINSKYALAYLENYRRSAIPKMYYPDDFRNLPIPIVSLAEQKPLIALVKKRLAATPKTSVKLDEQIDALVYALYGLTAEEIAVVEG